MYRIEPDDGLSKAVFPTVQRPDENNVVSHGRAVETIDAQPDPPWLEGLPIDDPGSIAILKREGRRLKALVGDPERDRLDGDGHVHGDRRIDVEAEIAVSQRRTLTAFKPCKNQIAPRCNDAQFAFGTRPAQAPADGLEGFASRRQRRKIGAGSSIRLIALAIKARLIRPCTLVTSMTRDPVFCIRCESDRSGRDQKTMAFRLHPAEGHGGVCDPLTRSQGSVRLDRWSNRCKPVNEVGGVSRTSEIRVFGKRCRECLVDVDSDDRI